MIYDGLGAIGLYRGLTKGLDVLIDWLSQNDPTELPLGITEIDGKRVFANVMNAKTRAFEDARFETHRKYMDVQIDLEGAERFKTTPGVTVAAGEFDVAGDKGYCHGAPDNDDLLDGTLGDNHFVVFMVGEPHMPNLVTEGAEVGPLKKICFKVVSDAFWGEV